jgi:rubrerythrin
VRSTSIARALRSAVLLSLTEPTLACGETLDLGLDGGSRECALAEARAPGGLCGTEITFSLLGPASACAPDDAGSTTQCGELCSSFEGRPGTCTVYTDDAGGHVVCAYPLCSVGRRPEGLANPTFDGPSLAARYLAEVSYLEAASVDAFETLTRELDAYDAPAGLRAASRRAARDEVRHARVFKRLAERAGARVPEVTIDRREVRRLEDMAIENAVEGCVRETFGAAVAMIQAQRAGDAGVRRVMQRIARDETRHAELSWALARWLDTKLDVDGRRRVQQARTRAVEALVREAAHEPDASLKGRLGIPSASQAHALLDHLSSTLLWCVTHSKERAAHNAAGT